MAVVMATIRQSDLKLWSRCPLAWRYQNVDKLPRSQGGSAVFGTVLHELVLELETTKDLPAVLAGFERYWLDPVAYLGEEKGRIDYYERGRSWRKFNDMGPRILADWWALIQWESDVVLAREYEFDVPIGDGHRLHGTVDKLAIRYLAALDSSVVLVSDYKTAGKRPTYEYLEDDLQFTAYTFATLQPEFWENLPDGLALYERLKDLPRRGEWVHLQDIHRMDAGPREQHQYNRLIYAVNAMAESVALRIFVPDISGATCRYCEYRNRCGLPDIPDVA